MVSKQDNHAASRFCLVQQGRQHLDLVARPAGIDLLALQERVVDGVHDDTNDPAMRRSDLFTHFGGQTGIVCLLQRCFVEQDRHGTATAMRAEPRMRSKTVVLHRGIALP